MDYRPRLMCQCGVDPNQGNHISLLIDQDLKYFGVTTCPYTLYMHNLYTLNICMRMVIVQIFLVFDSCRGMPYMHESANTSNASMAASVLHDQPTLNINPIKPCRDLAICIDID